MSSSEELEPVVHTMPQAAVDDDTFNHDQMLHNHHDMEFAGQASTFAHHGESAATHHGLSASDVEISDDDSSTPEHSDIGTVADPSNEYVDVDVDVDVDVENERVSQSSRNVFVRNASIRQLLDGSNAKDDNGTDDAELDREFEQQLAVGSDSSDSDQFGDRGVMTSVDTTNEHDDNAIQVIGVQPAHNFRKPKKLRKRKSQRHLLQLAAAEAATAAMETDVRESHTQSISQSGATTVSPQIQHNANANAKSKVKKKKKKAMTKKKKKKATKKKKSDSASNSHYLKPQEAHASSHSTSGRHSPRSPRSASPVPTRSDRTADSKKSNRRIEHAEHKARSARRLDRIHNKMEQERDLHLAKHPAIANMIQSQAAAQSQTQTQTQLQSASLHDSDEEDGDTVDDSFQVRRSSTISTGELSRHNSHDLNVLQRRATTATATATAAAAAATSSSSSNRHINTAPRRDGIATFGDDASVYSQADEQENVIELITVSVPSAAETNSHRRSRQRKHRTKRNRRRRHGRRNHNAASGSGSGSGSGYESHTSIANSDEDPQEAARREREAMRNDPDFSRMAEEQDYLDEHGICDDGTLTRFGCGVLCFYWMIGTLWCSFIELIVVMSQREVFNDSLWLGFMVGGSLVSIGWFMTTKLICRISPCHCKHQGLTARGWLAYACLIAGVTGAVVGSIAGRYYFSKADDPAEDTASQDKARNLGWAMCIAAPVLWPLVFVAMTMSPWV
jgi:hypothetical protein